MLSGDSRRRGLTLGFVGGNITRGRLLLPLGASLALKDVGLPYFGLNVASLVLESGEDRITFIIGLSSVDLVGVWIRSNFSAPSRD